LLIGGGGRKILTIAGREADIVGIAPSATTGAVDATTAADAAADRTDQKIEWVRAAAGDRFDDIEMNFLVFASILTDDRDGMAETMAGAFGLSPAEAMVTPHALFGSVEQMCDDLEQRRERWGASFVVLPGPSMEIMAPVVERLSGT
jgi:hypothetical protein